MMKDKKNKYDFLIVSPRQRFGGCVVLHLLCKELSERGYNSKIFYFGRLDEKAFKNKFVLFYKYLFFLLIDTSKLILVKLFKMEFDGYSYLPVRGTKRKFFPWFDKNKTIVIYPEMVYGNFLNAKKVVRYFLYYNRFPGDDNAYGKDDLFICYREIFNDERLNPQRLKLELLSFDSELYKQTNFGERKGNCYILRKGKDRTDLPKQLDGIVIDNLSEKEKIRIFNECEYCYCYDLQTFYSTIACICGCKVIIVPEEGKTRADYLTGDDKKYGVAFGLDEEEIKYATDTCHLVKEQLQRELQRNQVEVDNFCLLCNDFFKA